MACEFLYNEVQSVSLNAPVVFRTSIPCSKGYVYHEGETGNFILKGIVNCPCSEFAQYQVTFNGNIAIPTGGEITPIAIALTVNGEERTTSRAIFTPTVVNEYGNVTSTAIIKVPKGCCFNLSIDSVSATESPTVTPTPIISVQNANLTISRIA